MTTNYASLGSREDENVKQLEQHPLAAQRARWSDDVISSPESASAFQIVDDLSWRKSSSSFSNMTDGSDIFHTPCDEEMTPWVRIPSDAAAEVDGSHPEMTFHPGQNLTTQLYEDYNVRPEDYDNTDDVNCNSLSATGRDRRGMYVPSHMAGPELDIETEEFAPPTQDTWKKPRLISSHMEVETTKRTQHLKFERVESVSASSPTATLSRGLQTERAEAQIISSSLPRQLTMKSVSRSFDRQSSSSVTSSSSVASPVTDRGECLVVHQNKRSEITVKTKTKVSKVDSYHGPKYGGSSAFAGALSDGEPAGKNPTSQGRPSRRSRNDNVTVVKAVVSETREHIQATLVESKHAWGEEDIVATASGGEDVQRVLNEEGVSCYQHPSEEHMAVDVISSEGEVKSGTNKRKGADSVNWANAATFEGSDEGRDLEAPDQLLQLLQELQSAEEQDDNALVPSSVAAVMDEDREDTEEEQERQIVKGGVEMEVDRNTMEEPIDDTSRMVAYAADDSMEETRLQRRRSIHPQRKPRESKGKVHPSSRMPPSFTPSTGRNENDVQAVREVDAYRILPATNMEELQYYRQGSASTKQPTATGSLPYPTKTASKSG